MVAILSFSSEQNESTGTKTFTLFGPAGGGTNLTAFHFETKVGAQLAGSATVVRTTRVVGPPAALPPHTLGSLLLPPCPGCACLSRTQRRRSYNLGTGDFIVQPLATQYAMR